MANPTLDTLLNHRSIRRFAAEKLTAAEVTTLVDAAQHEPTSTFSQQYSIISITDPQQLATLGDITGHHWLEQAGHFFLFLADQYRNAQLAPKTSTTTANLHSTDKLLAGIFDASIAAEAMVVAGESLGLGSTIMGSILNDAAQVISLCQLPPLTFPVFGLAMGHPAEQPEQKPRLPQSLMHFTNHYQPLASTVDLASYDQTIADYYQSRGTHQRAETFSHHIAAELSHDPQQRAKLAQVLQTQGFLNSLP